MAEIIAEIIFAFDLDGTLTNQDGLVSEELYKSLSEISEKYKMVIVSGSPINKIQNVLGQLIQKTPEQWLVFSNTGGLAWSFGQEGKLIRIFQALFNRDLKAALEFHFNNFISQTNNPAFKSIIFEDRDTQISLTLIPRNASEQVKAECDPDGQKRNILLIEFSDYLKLNQPDILNQIGFTVTGRTTIDILPKGVNKALAIKMIAEIFEIGENQVLFIGNEIFPGGNDFPVTSTQCAYFGVTGSNDVSTLLANFLG
jgi:HAD superfamily hydrolase (TIGR01484 family)